MQLDVRLDGFAAPIGVLVSDEDGAVAFQYHQAYLDEPGALPLSLSLPLASEPYGDVAARAYFDNLLQERDTARHDIIAKYGIANDDIAGILYHLGKDCTGAVSVLPLGAPAVKSPGNLATDYTPYTERQLIETVTALHERQPLPDDLQDPSPLAGVQSKIAVTLLPDGDFAFPREGAPTTHILKVPERRHHRDALREHKAMEMARAIGFPTASTRTLDIAGINCLLVERFDRRVEKGIVSRVHQEDFCQALGLPARLKYERRGRPERRFSVAGVRTVLDRMTDPAGEKLRFARTTLFDILIGNVDGHAKNFSLFHLPGNRMISTPRYDVVPTMLDRRTTDEFAYRIGSAERLPEVDNAALDGFLADLGFASAAGRRRILAGLLPVLDAVNDLIPAAGDGDKDFGDLVATNIRTLCNGLGLDPPEPAASLDTFVR